MILLQGGGTGVFASVCMNLMGRTGSADYAVTGSWSAKAAKEASKYGKVNHVFPKLSKFTTIPDESTWTLSDNASYLYYCDNETVDGVEFPFVPKSKGVPLVCDMSSNIFSRPFDIKQVSTKTGHWPLAQQFNYPFTRILTVWHGVRWSTKELWSIWYYCGSDS